MWSRATLRLSRSCLRGWSRAGTRPRLCGTEWSSGAGSRGVQPPSCTGVAGAWASRCPRRSAILRRTSGSASSCRHRPTPSPPSRPSTARQLSRGAHGPGKEQVVRRGIAEMIVQTLEELKRSGKTYVGFRPEDYPRGELGVWVIEGGDEAARPLPGRLRVVLPRPGGSARRSPAPTPGGASSRGGLTILRRSALPPGRVEARGPRARRVARAEARGDRGRGSRAR